MTGVMVKCHGYQCVERKRERERESLGNNGCMKSWGSCFFPFCPSVLDGNEIFWAEARDGSVNDPIADSAHVFHVMSALSTSILSNYLLFHREKCMAPSGGVCMWLTLDRQFFFSPTAAPTDEERKRIACLWHKCRHRVKFPTPILKMWKQRQRRTT